MKDDNLPLLVFGAIGFIFVFLLGTMVGSDLEAKLKNAEAIKRGHATWVVAPDGSTTFQWKESCK